MFFNTDNACNLFLDDFIQKVFKLKTLSESAKIASILQETKEFNFEVKKSICESLNSGMERQKRTIDLMYERDHSLHSLPLLSVFEEQLAYYLQESFLSQTDWYALYLQAAQVDHVLTEATNSVDEVTDVEKIDLILSEFDKSSKELSELKRAVHAFMLDKSIKKLYLLVQEILKWVGLFKNNIELLSAFMVGAVKDLKKVISKSEASTRQHLRVALLNDYEHVSTELKKISKFVKEFEALLNMEEIQKVDNLESLTETSEQLNGMFITLVKNFEFFHDITKQLKK